MPTETTGRKLIGTDFQDPNKTLAEKLGSAFAGGVTFLAPVKGASAVKGTTTAGRLETGAARAEAGAAAHSTETLTPSSRTTPELHSSTPTGAPPLTTPTTPKPAVAALPGTAATKPTPTVPVTGEATAPAKSAAPAASAVGPDYKPFTTKPAAVAAATPEKITTDAAKTIDTPTTGDKAFTEMPAADRAGTDAAKVPDTPTTGDKTFTLTPAADGAGRAIDGPSTGGTRPTDSSLLVPGSPIDPRFRTINGEIRSFLADGTHVNGDLFNPATWNAEKFSAPQLLRDSCLTEP